MAMVRSRAVVTGDVQGVGFRWATRVQAQSLGLKGFVRNLANGSVEVEAHGDEAGVASLVEWLHTGPPGARVDGVDVRALDLLASRDAGFVIRH